MKVRELQDRRVLIVGYGVTGASVARFLAKYKIPFNVAQECDESTAAQLATELNCQVFTELDAQLLCQYQLLVLSPGVPRSTPAVATAIASGVDVIGDIELFADEVDAPVIAVTGSNGKSTVVSWIVSTLKGAGIDAVACGNIGLPALEAMQLGADVFVLEISSYQLESTRSLEPLSAAVLNVSDDHLDRYDDIEHYASVKRRLLDKAKNRIINRDDKRTWPEPHQQEHCSWFSLAVGAENSSVQATSLSQATPARWHRCSKQEQLWLCDDHIALLAMTELRLPGEHNAANALAVLALVEPLAIPFTALKEGLLEFAGLPHRSEYLGEQSGVRWYNDSKGTNVDACVKAVTAMPGPVILIAGGISKGADFTPLQMIMKQHVRLLVLIGRDREIIAQQLAGTAQTILADTLMEAVTLCKQKAQSGDVVLLSPACSSFDMFRNFEDRGEQFTAAVEQVLAA